MRIKAIVLTILPMLILVFGTEILLLKSGTNLIGTAKAPWLLLGLVALLALAVEIFLIRSRQKFDIVLFPLVFTLASTGIIMVARLKPALFVAQLRWLLLGMVLFLLVLLFYKTVLALLDYQYILAVLCLLTLCSALFFGTEIGGSRNWITFGSFAVQPSEFGKILLILFLSAYLAEHREVLMLKKRKFLLALPEFRFIAPLLSIWGIAILMFVVQRDLGSALLFFGIATFMTYMATARKTYVCLATGGFFLAALASYHFFAHVKTRFDIWLHPWTDPDGRAYQIVQSLFAFASGGVWGTGFAHGYPTLIPEVHTDFIFAAIGEELGLLGALAIMILYVLFFHRAIEIALSLKEERQILLAAGVAVTFFLQAFIIIAGVTKFLPLTGITLPFVSYGGSSMVSGFLLLGLLVALSNKENRHV